MSEFDKRKIDQMVREMSPDDIDDVRDIAFVGDSLLEWIEEKELRFDLWPPLLLAICRKMHDDTMIHMQNPCTFEEYLVRYAIEATEALKSCDG